MPMPAKGAHLKNKLSKKARASEARWCRVAESRSAAICHSNDVGSESKHLTGDDVRVDVFVRNFI